MIEWLKANPLVWELALFPVLTALVTWLFKPRTEVEYAAMHPRLAALLKLVAAVGFDAPKILDALTQVATGKSRTAAEERTKQRGTADVRAVVEGMVILAAIAVACAGAFYMLTGCGPAQTAEAAAKIEAERQEYRAAVLECARKHADDCAAFDACQALEALSRGLPRLGSCVTDAGADGAP